MLLIGKGGGINAPLPFLPSNAAVHCHPAPGTAEVLRLTQRTVSVSRASLSVEAGRATGQEEAAVEDGQVRAGATFPSFATTFYVSSGS